MTTAELHHEFNLEWRANANNINRIFYSYEIDKFLNKAQETIIERYYKDFEKSEKSREAVKELIRKADGVYQGVGNKTNGRIYNVTKPRYILEEYILSGTTEITVKPLTRDEYQANKKNPFKKPYDELVWKIDSVGGTGDNNIELITDGATTITSYHVIYIKEPEELDMVESPTAENELSESAQEEMILEAVRQAYASITSVPDYELQTTEVKEREQLK